MKIRFLGAAGTVTGSKFLVESKQAKVLVDCGLFQGIKALRLQNWQSLPEDPAQIDAVVLTHAHIDHSGFIPALVRDGFKGPVFCTEPTHQLCKILLPDCAYIQEEDAAYANRRGFSKHKPALPLYTQMDAEVALKSFMAKPLRKVFKVHDIEVEFYMAGHILGASFVRIQVGSKSVVFSGDLGRYQDLIEPAPEDLPQCDLLVLESTYGDRLHPKVDPIEEVGRIVNRVVDRRGVLLVPSFAVGRAQTLLFAIHQAMEKKLCPRIPIYVDSPMATQVTELYQRYRQWHRLDEMQCRQTCGQAHFINSVEESKSLGHKKGPLVIISASGMLTGGRILHHLMSFAGDPANLVLLAGFQAPGTRGATLAGGGRRLKMHGEYVDIEAEVMQLDMLSAHGDQQELLQWLRSGQHRPRRVALVHGEPAAADALRRHIVESFGLGVEIPSQGQSISI